MVQNTSDQASRQSANVTVGYRAPSGSDCLLSRVRLKDSVALTWSMVH